MSSTTDSAADGVPLISQVLLVRATVSFSLGTPCVFTPSTSPVSPSAVEAALLTPKLRIVAHYALGASGSSSGGGGAPPSPATLTPEEERRFFEVNPALHGLLSSLAAARLAERMRLRRLQTDVVHTAVKLTRALATTSPAAAAAASRRGAWGVTSASEDSITDASSSSADLPRSLHEQQLQGLVSAATASFGDDAAWSSTITPRRPQLNAWCQVPVAAEGCFLTIPTSGFVHWCELAAARSCASPNPSPTSAAPAFPPQPQQKQQRLPSSGASVEPDTRGGPMRYTDVVHYASVTASPKRVLPVHTAATTPAAAAACSALRIGGNGYVHGYAFVMEGDVFTGSSGVEMAAAAAAARATAAQDARRPSTSLRASASQSLPEATRSGISNGNEDLVEREEASVLLWCVLSDAPVYNFMKSLSSEVVAATSYVAQRLYHEHVDSADAAAASTSSSAAFYTAVLDDAVREEVVRPLAAALLTPGCAGHRTLPGEMVTIKLDLKRSRHGSGGGRIATRPLTSSMSSQLSFRRPLDLLYPHADVPLPLLLLSFGEEALRVLQSLLMQEERVVVIGATPQHASACVVSLLALLAPLTWVSPLLPFLPPHMAGVTGLLQTLVQPSYEVQQQRQAGKPGAPVSAASQRAESSGFLVGSTAAIQPYLMLLTSSPWSASGGGADGAGGGVANGARPPRVWIADARTGCVGVCPEDPIARFVRADGATADLAERLNASTSPPVALADVSGANAWGRRAHVNMRLLLPHNFDRDTARHNYSALYNTARMNMRTVVESNVMETAPLDLLPAFSDDLRDLLHRVATHERRLAFRRGLDAVAQHTQARLEYLESLAARLRRGLRQARLTACGTGGRANPLAATQDSTYSNASFSSGATELDDDDDNLVDDITSDGAAAAAPSMRGLDGNHDDDEAASLRAITAALTQSFAHSFAAAPVGSGGGGDGVVDASGPSFCANPVAAPPPFPVLSPSEVWQLQAGLFDYVVGRFTGAYRRGLSNGVSPASGTPLSARPRAGPVLETTVFIVAGTDQNYPLAERVAQTHLFKQFECILLAAEAVGVRRLFTGSSSSSIGSPNSGGPTSFLSASSIAAQLQSRRVGPRGCGSDMHPALSDVRALTTLALLYSRARLYYPELYHDLASVDATGLVYTAVVNRWFANRPSHAGGSAAAAAAAAVPAPIRLMGGASTGPDGSVVSPTSGNATAVFGNSGSSGGVRGFFSKAAKAVKHGLTSGGGGGSGGGGRGGYRSSARARGMQIAYLPAATSCLHCFNVPPFSALPDVPQPLTVVSYADPSTSSGTFTGATNTAAAHAAVAAAERRGRRRGRFLRRGRRRSGARGFVDAAPLGPQRVKWARQQEYQQQLAIDADFTLDECAAVMRAGGQVSNFNVNTSMHGSIVPGSFAGGSAHVSGFGLELEMFDAMARAGGRISAMTGASADGSQRGVAALRIMSGASLYLCHSLPLDVLHNFDTYQPLLCPSVSMVAESVSASTTGGGFADAWSPAAYMRVGLLCPTNINVWREGEARATRAVLAASSTAPPPPPQSAASPRGPFRSPRSINTSFAAPQLQRGEKTPSPAAVTAAAAAAAASAALQDSLWTFPDPPLPTTASAAQPAVKSPRRTSQSSAAAADAAAPQPSVWGAFTSGAPQDFAARTATPPLRPSWSAVAGPLAAPASPTGDARPLQQQQRTGSSPGSGRDGGGGGALSGLSSFASASATCASLPARLSQQVPQVSEVEWDTWGVQAPSVVVGVLPPASAAATRGANAGAGGEARRNANPAAATPRGSGGDGGAGWSSGAPLAPPPALSVASYGNGSMGLAGVSGSSTSAVATAAHRPLHPLPALACAAPPPVVVAAVLPPASRLVAPAPRSVMDELFADLQTTAASSQPKRQEEGSAPRRPQTLDDFF